MHEPMADASDRKLAYPVYRGPGNVKYVLATPSDLRVMEKLRDRTEADQAELRLTKIKIPSHPRPRSCIAVTMPYKCHKILGRTPATNVIGALRVKGWKYQGQTIRYRDIGSACKLAGFNRDDRNR